MTFDLIASLATDETLVQSSCRSLIIDTLPIPKQQLGSAWGKRCLSFPNASPIIEVLKRVGWWPSVP